MTRARSFHDPSATLPRGVPEASTTRGRGVHGASEELGCRDLPARTHGPLGTCLLRPRSVWTWAPRSPTITAHVFRLRRKLLGDFARRYALQRFAEEMIVHLLWFAPRQSQVVGPEAIRRLAYLGAERAALHGVTDLRLVRFHVELMAMFGSHFDEDPLLPWAGTILRDPSIPGEVPRMTLLHEAMLRYLDVLGDTAVGVAVLHRLRWMLHEGLRPGALATARQRLDALHWIHPERCAHVGEAALLQIVHHGASEAARWTMGTDQGEALILGLLFSAGHGFAVDPLHPWVQPALADSPDRDLAARVERLRVRTRIYLDHVITYLEGRADVSP